jgi:hypothetical protein
LAKSTTSGSVVSSACFIICVMSAAMPKNQPIGAMPLKL